MCAAATSACEREGAASPPRTSAGKQRYPHKAPTLFAAGAGTAIGPPGLPRASPLAIGGRGPSPQACAGGGAGAAAASADARLGPGTPCPGVLPPLAAYASTDMSFSVSEASEAAGGGGSGTGLRALARSAAGGGGVQPGSIPSAIELLSGPSLTSSSLGAPQAGG